MTTFEDMYKTPWEYDYLYREGRPTSEKKAIVYAKESYRVCTIKGEFAEERAKKIVNAVNKETQ